MDAEDQKTVKPFFVNDEELVWWMKEDVIWMRKWLPQTEEWEEKREGKEGRGVAVLVTIQGTESWPLRSVTHFCCRSGNPLDVAHRLRDLSKSNHILCKTITLLLTCHLFPFQILKIDTNQACLCRPPPSAPTHPLPCYHSFALL